MEDTWERILNEPTAAGGADAPGPAVPAFSIEQTEKIPPKTAFEKLQRMADEVLAKRDRHSIGGIHRALEDEIQRRNNA